MHNISKVRDQINHRFYLRILFYALLLQISHFYVLVVLKIKYQLLLFLSYELSWSLNDSLNALTIECAYLCALILQCNDQAARLI